MAKTKKLNSMRLLEQNDIPYEVLHYDTSTRDAQEVAELIGLPEFMVYKTLVVQSITTNKPMLVMLASDRQLDLKAMAAAANEKKVQMATHADAEKLTGLQVGGISALMLTQKNWPVYLDQPASELQHIVISAGERGTQLRVPVMSLMNLLHTRLAHVSRDA
ncbi:aminoacyl-tRNA deacylase [Phototrophicus methaneseepsis]|uniref:Cys-tRNA(Pro)/Cys-tRNA(Cys) deacylase n=1 Tax=Phototrophicus methaneseepsis TaxID=2710758 RepID=A0A7S8IDS8_9CHLR|nr:YbaK/EbsC family protein [Phototrophicus methaneseepsis]QPC81856.1 aminoacyl-tRNA deacylase [Phototrophicus methaneseepsis]